MAEQHVWWTELMTTDIDRASRFYGDVMGWTAVKVSKADPRRAPEPGERSYTVFRKGEETVCGVFKMDESEFGAKIPDYWFTYVSVANVDDACAKVAEQGGQVLRPPRDVPYVGRIAVIQDPSGAVVGIGSPVVTELA
jgi:predicted enzyme related to lactoylglutathione lyase